MITPTATGVTNFQIAGTGFTDGSLFQHDGTTPIASGDFITLLQGSQGLIFKPNTGFTGQANFTVQQASGNSTEDLIGPAATATVNVNAAATTQSGHPALST